ncbi:chemotaxis protein CheB [Spirosoma endbachense]|uniref:protein-glutamate methylesterase n=1 Tax=Spirosoma endbachense TaxID=2666025 RepID=A0A6P1VYS4_9BACT|nr:chemotaxis protein CheB [Spirosoma endbachense]QHV97252.1 chemotaxis protein CheB [Spirosoma endbachense]
MAENRLNNPVKAVVIGGSAGSLDVLLKLLPALQPIVSFTAIIVLHRKNSGDSTLEDLLAGRTTIPVREIEDKDTLRPDIIYVAPADYHLLIEKNLTFSLDDSEKVNYSRPSLDVTFESAADVYGDSLVGILLSGANSDGTNGLMAIKKAGGITIAQKPETAQSAFMPQQAIFNVPIDFILDIPELISFINSLNK